MKKSFRLPLTIALLLLTAGVFGYYLSHHQDLIRQLRATSPWLVVVLILLYIIWFGAVAAILLVSLRICRRHAGFKEGFLLNGYSTLVNFFVPGQGGIAVRGIYLKRTHKLKIRNYIFVSLLYYGCYAFISAVMLLIRRPLWQIAGGGLLVGFVSVGVCYLYYRRGKLNLTDLELTPPTIALLFGATLFQSCIQTAIFAVELHNVNGRIGLSQAISYTGAANFSLFVALTPGAIGIRETFLLFSRRLHHISEANIISASLIDRSVYIVFLGIMFLATLGFHAQYRSVLKKATKAGALPSSGTEDPSAN